MIGVRRQQTLVQRHNQEAKCKNILVKQINIQTANNKSVKYN